MRKDYLNYTIDDFLEDKEFISWVNHGRNSDAWEKLVMSSDHIREKAHKAREIMTLLNTVDIKLNKKEKLALWIEIEKFDHLYHRKLKIRQNYRLLKYAAIFLTLMALGGAAFLYYLKPHQELRFFSDNLIHDTNEARLILKSGEEILLEKTNSSIEIVSSEEIHINNEKIVSFNERDKAQAISTLNQVIIPYGKNSQISLSDGTKVWLNAGTRFAFPDEFTGKTREVFLEGEAYFDVSHNPSKPFIVNAKDISVRVLGTRFNISAYNSDSNIETLLLDGSVIINDNSTSVFSSKKGTVIEPGQFAAFSKDNKSFQIKTVNDPELYIAWTSGWFSFSRESLPSVLHKLKKYYNITFNLSDDIPNTDLISGKLDLKDSIEEVMLVLADLAEIEFKIEKKIIIISKLLKRK